MATTTHDMNELKRRMHGAIAVLKSELGGPAHRARLRAPARPGAGRRLRHEMPLNQVATVTVPEPRMISVQVWDRSMVHAVEKAIVDSNLGLTPSTEGQVIRLRIPELNEERRQRTGQGRAQICRDRAGRGAPRAPRRPGRPQEAGKGPQDQPGRSRALSAEVQKATDGDRRDRPDAGGQGKGDPHGVRSTTCPRRKAPRAEPAGIRSAAARRHHHGWQRPLGGRARPAARRGPPARRRGAAPHRARRRSNSASSS